jgi:RNA polymerase sigma-70 factor (ECF subfamily)
MRQLSSAQGPCAGGLPEPSEWVERYGDALYRYALARLRRPEDAEEVVQETLLAALRTRGQFQGRAQPLTWLTGILKHKVVNCLRTAARSVPQTDVDDPDMFFTARGKWRRPPGRWNDPTAQAERADFWRTVRRCMEKLPPRMAEAFTLRTLDELTPQTVCADLDISPSNFWVLMHRARLRLVSCLQMNWFDAGG